MPRDTITPTQHTILSSDEVVVGVLGELPLKPNRRIFHLASGDEVSQYTVASLLARGFLKVISDDGPRRYYTVTELGRAAARHALVSGRKVRVETRPR